MPKKSKSKKQIPAMWLAMAVILVIVFGTIYAVVQQVERQNANYPQVQLAEDSAAALNAGASIRSVVPPGPVNMNNSLAPFVIVYAKNGSVRGGNGRLNGSIPCAPFGILQASNGTSYHIVTWQPSSDVRIAAITVSAHNYYVLSGRSLKLTEQTENDAFALSLLGGVCAEVVLLVTYMLSRKQR